MPESVTLADGLTVELRFAAILYADLADSEGLEEIHKAATIARIESHWGALVEPAIVARAGRVIVRPARRSFDTFLFEFPNPADAVACAVEVQQGMAEREAGVSAELRIQYRMGLHAGKVVIDGDGVYGDTVGVAAQMARFSSPGGLCVSGTAYDLGKPWEDLTFEDGPEIGDVPIANHISRRIHLWHCSTPSP